jgi:luciferase family oxidoreductase group 1
VPELRLLGSSDQSAQLAAHFGLAFSFAHFISEAGGVEAVARYRDGFRPSVSLSAPHASIGVFVPCADTDAAARRLALSRDLSRLRLDRGEIAPIPSSEEFAAAALAWSAAEQARVERNRRRQVVGTPDTVRARLEALAADFGVGELVVVSICHEFEARVRSYELLADAFELQPRVAA